MYQTTKKQFELFCSEVSRWIDFFGLYDWRLDIIHEHWQEHENTLGWCCADWENGTAVIGLNLKLHEKISDDEIRSTARHEVLELIMWPLWECALERFSTMEQMNVARHKAIRQVESALDRLK